MYIYINLDICIPIYLYIHPSMHACIHASLHACMPAYIPTYLHTDIPTYLQTYMPTFYVHTYMEGCKAPNSFGHRGIAGIACFLHRKINHPFRRSTSEQDWKKCPGFGGMRWTLSWSATKLLGKKQHKSTNTIVRGIQPANIRIGPCLGELLTGFNQQ